MTPEQLREAAAVMLSKEEEDSILALIPQQRDAAIDAAKRGGE